MAAPVGVAVVGCGFISSEYLGNLCSFADVKVVFCADIDVARAKAQAQAFNVPSSGTVEEALTNPEVELVVNLTIPAAHATVTAAALGAGKHVWTEKPLAIDVASGRDLVTAAELSGLLLGCAPDTMLGAGVQTARRLIESGAIGKPVTALALMQAPGPELWHPDPEFLYQRGAGPLFDIGPYYLSALATIFGPAASVAAVARRSHDTRVIATGPKAGTSFAVEAPTHTSALLSYAGGGVATTVFSFESPLRRQGFLEITGTEATLAVPDPNRFDGTVRLRTAADSDWREVPAEGAADGRGLGVLDMARAVRHAVPHRATGELGLHVLETMEAIALSAESGEFESVTSSFAMPEVLDPAWDPRVLTV
jgi:predicted dehydrogenase